LATPQAASDTYASSRVSKISFGKGAAALSDQSA
jgi:hypothetical protein